MYEFCNEDINKFILLLRKGVYPYEYVGSWNKFDEAFPKKEDFHSSLNIKNNTSVDYIHAKIVFKNFNEINLGDYYDFYVQSNTFLHAEVFENFRNKCIEIYELNPANFLCPPNQHGKHV